MMSFGLQQLVDKPDSFGNEKSRRPMKKKCFYNMLNQERNNNVAMQECVFHLNKRKKKKSRVLYSNEAVGGSVASVSLCY